MAAPSTPHILRMPAGRDLVAVQFLHALAQGITIVALPWLILEAGGSVTGAGLVMTATFLPFVLLGLPAGIAGDRLPRRTLLAGALGVQALVGLVLWLAMPAGGVSTAVLFGAAFCLGSGRVFVDAAMFGAIGALVPRAGMLSAQATIASAFNLGYYGGPALGGLLMAFAGAGTTLAVVVGALAAALGVAVTRLGGAGEAGPAAHGPDRPAMSDGLRLLFTEPTLRGLALIAVSWSVLSSGVITLAVPHLHRDLGLSGAPFSAVMATGVAAMMVSPVLLHRLGTRVRDTRILVVALAAYLVPATAFATAGSAVTAALSYGPMMLATAVCAATIIGARARRTPAHLQALAGVSGRMLVIGGFTVGSALASTVAGLVSPAAVYIAIGLGMTVLSAVSHRAVGRPRPVLHALPAPAARHGRPADAPALALRQAA